MKRGAFIIILNVLFTCNIYANNCDSIIVTYTNEQSPLGNWSGENITTSTYRNGLLISNVTDNDGFQNVYVFLYDTLNRLSETFVNGNLYVSHYYNSNGLDSAKISYNNNGSQFILNSVVYDYDLNNNLHSTVYEQYDSLTQTWDTTQYLISYYSLDSLTRTDSIYPENIFGVGYNITVWDSLHRIIQTSSRQNNSRRSTFTVYDSFCFTFPVYKNTVFQSWGPGVTTQSINSYWSFDSLCRPKSKIDSIGLDHNGTVHNYLSLTDYYYADCNHIIIAGQDTIGSCEGNTDTLNLLMLGGTGSYSIVWWPNDSLSDPTIINPVIYTDINKLYNVSVQDSLGNTAYFLLTVLANQFTTTITDASCSTCTNGSIQVHFSSIPNNFLLTVFPFSNNWNGTTLSGLSPGDYYICSVGLNCSFCDSVHVGSLISVDEIVNRSNIQLYPNPVNEELFIKIKGDVFQPGTEWSLRNIEGRVIMTNSINQNQFSISVEDISSGIYLFEIILDARYVYKVIVE